MIMITSNEITFERATFDKPNSCWQDIVYKNKEIGALHSSYKGLNKPVERYQRLVPDKFIPELENWYHSEDDGYIFAVFYTLDEFLHFVNEIERIS